MLSKLPILIYDMCIMSQVMNVIRQSKWLPTSLAMPLSGFPNRFGKYHLLLKDLTIFS